uniref:Uncharacterized protein n=1 Tax=Panagrolaimus sp. JU765 TaxID=591449 RepID=A0AC34PVR5_9BILA
MSASVANDTEEATQFHDSDEEPIKIKFPKIWSFIAIIILFCFISCVTLPTNVHQESQKIVDYRNPDIIKSTIERFLSQHPKKLPSELHFLSKEELIAEDNWKKWKFDGRVKPCVELDVPSDIPFSITIVLNSTTEGALYSICKEEKVLKFIWIKLEEQLSETFFVCFKTIATNDDLKQSLKQANGNDLKVLWWAQLEVVYYCQEFLKWSVMLGLTINKSLLPRLAFDIKEFLPEFMKKKEITVNESDFHTVFLCLSNKMRRDKYGCCVAFVKNIINSSNHPNFYIRELTAINVETKCRETAFSRTNGRYFKFC